MPVPKQELSPEELQRMIVEVLVRAERSLSTTEIHKGLQKAFRPPSKTVKAVVESMVKSGRIFHFEKRYSAEPDRTLHDGIVKALKKERLTRPELAKELGAKPAIVGRVIDELIAEGALYAYPKQGRAVPYGLRPPTAADLLAPQLPKLLAPLLKVAKTLGISEDDARDALRQLLGGAAEEQATNRPASKSADSLLDVMLELNPAAANGALIYLPHLRSAVADQYRDKTSFDRAVLGLLARGAIEMQSHPTPSMLNALEREAMIENGRGGYYTAIALR